jgi:hypothetical protein
MPPDVKITNHSSGQLVPIPRLPHGQAKRTLGVILSPEGAHTAQLRHTLRYAKEIAGKFKNTKMSQRAKLMAEDSVIEPAINYPLFNTFFTDHEIKPIESVISQLKCALLGLNRNFPRSILHGPPSLGGIGIPSTRQKTTRERLIYFFFYIRRKSNSQKKYSASIIYTQMELGIFSQFFSSSYSQYRHLATISLCVQIWRETEPFRVFLKPTSNATWTPHPLGADNIPLMELATSVYDKKGS